MNKKLAKETALVIIDVQKAIDNLAWSTYGVRNNPDAEKNMADLQYRCKVFNATDICN